jgi:predicted nucleic acid-binding protein
VGKNLKVFLDSNVLFSVAYSGKGSSRSHLIYELRSRGGFDIFISELVLKEAVWNMERKKPEHLSFLKGLINKSTVLDDILIRFKNKELETLPLNDRIILTTALYHGMDFFITGNARDFRDFYRKKIGETLILRPVDFIFQTFNPSNKAG